MIRPATISVIVFRLVLVIVLVATVAIMIATRRLMLVGVVALFLELAVRVLTGLFSVRTGNGAVRMRGHGVLALTATGPTRQISCGTG
ncbi:hypothetical protein UB44_16315 [Burkholderiaceae bacterium 26]|nr:hypothetical protein UB44_16315 [Burkholderiaceae bacterium 26]